MYSKTYFINQNYGKRSTVCVEGLFSPETAPSLVFSGRGATMPDSIQSHRLYSSLQASGQGELVDTPTLPSQYPSQDSNLGLQNCHSKLPGSLKGFREKTEQHIYQTDLFKSLIILFKQNHLNSD